MQNELLQIIDIEEKYLIINGGLRTGKFYAACQKIVSKCMEKDVVSIIVADYWKYPQQILTEILGDTKFTFNKVSRCFEIESTGSRIYILRLNFDFLPNFKYAIIKGADYVNEDIFDKINRRSFKQIIFTCNPPQNKEENGVIIEHWLRKLDRSEMSKRINVPFFNKRF